MSYLKLILNNYKHYWRSHLLILIGIIISSTILSGALFIGDSVHHTLQQISKQHLGKSQYLISSNQHLLQAKLSQTISQQLQTPCCSILQITATATAPKNHRHLNQIQLLGIDQNFWKFAPNSTTQPIPKNHAIINPKIAQALNIKKGDEIILRFPNITTLPTDIPLTPTKNKTTVIRLTIAKIIPPKQFANFKTKNNQTPPANIFIDRHLLCKKLKIPDSANLILSQATNQNQLQQALNKAWTLADANIILKKIPHQNILQLTNKNIFIPPNISKPATTLPQKNYGIFTYFVNQISYKNKTVPYSFITTATLTPFPQLTQPPNTITINQWLAEQLQIIPPQNLTITYYKINNKQKLQEKSTKLTVQQIIPINPNDKHLTPNFPGLSNTKSCNDWDSSLPIDLSKITKQDQQYWQKYQATPKALISLQTAQQIWSNRFGNLTAIHSPLPPTKQTQYIKKIEQLLLTNLPPAQFGIIPIPSKPTNNQSTDFAQLFLGLSLFLILSSLLLTAMLISFSINHRHKELAILRTLGLSPSTIRNLYLSEKLLLAILGSTIGSLTAIQYNHIILTAITTTWITTTHITKLTPYIKPQTIILGFTINTILIIIITIIINHKQNKQQTINLIKNITPIPLTTTIPNTLTISILTLTTTLILTTITLLTPPQYTTITFFIAATLTLISTLSITLYLLQKIPKIHHLTNTTLAINNTMRRPWRSLAIITTIATAIFLINTIATNRHNINTNPINPKSGTGGFQLYAQTTIPITTNLNKPTNQNKLNLNKPPLNNCTFLQIRLRPGDDASCQNLNKPTQPQIIGLNPEPLQQNNSFTINKTYKKLPKKWTILNKKLPNNTIPAIADLTVIKWILHKKIGDTITYQNQQGKTIKIQLVAGLKNSIFQGSIIISKQNFKNNFPNISGNQIFLIKTQNKQINKQINKLAKIFEDQGIEITTTSQRLAEFNSIQNTYLDIFLLLGALALLLATLGMAIVVSQNIHERKTEIAILQTIGFTKKNIQKIILIEHLTLLLAGIISGTIASTIAIIPTIYDNNTTPPIKAMLTLIITITITSIIWTTIATLIATKDNPLQTLRNE